MGALDGILVVAIEQAVAAPFCTLRLADGGARVVKIERAGGETARHYDDTVQGVSSYFTWLNRGKESAVLDLKDAADLEVLGRMLDRADVLVQNLAPGALDRMGLTAEVIAQKYPHLIAVSISGYGRNTDYAAMKAYDLLVQAESGLCSITGGPETPAKSGVPVADIATGLNAHAAVLEALIARGVTGRGCQLEISMFDGIAEWMTVPLLHYEHAGLATDRHGLTHASISPYRPFECRDGTILIAVQTAQEWERFCSVILERPDLATRPDFATNTLRFSNRAALDAEAEPVFSGLTFDQVVARCSAAKIAWGRLSDVTDLVRHPALRRAPVTLPDGTEVLVPRPAGRSAGSVSGPLAETGQHTAAIRREFGTDRRC